MNLCAPSLTFKNIDHITEDLLLNNIETNLKMFLDWSFLNIGAWFDVNIQEDSLQNNDYSKLKLSNNSIYQTGTLWEAQRKDWVWEKNITCVDRTPITINNITVNNQTLNSNSFKIDYPNGRILLNSPVSPNSSVKLNYSYRFVQVYRANDSEWFNLLQYNGPSTTKIVDRQDNSWKIGNNFTLQLPAIVIEALPRSRSLPHEIGSSGLILEQDFCFHIFADNKNDRNKLIDILRLQQDLVIWLYDTNKLAQDNQYPIDYDGSLKDNALMYPEIIGQYPWKKCWLRNINVFETDSVDPNLHRASVRVTAEIIYN